MLLNRSYYKGLEMQNYIFYLCHKIPHCTVDNMMLLNFIILAYYYKNNEQELEELLQSPNPSLKIEEKSEMLNISKLGASTRGRAAIEQALKCSYTSFISKYNLTLRELTRENYIQLETIVNARGAITIHHIAFLPIGNLHFLGIEDKLIQLLDCLYDVCFSSFFYYQNRLKEEALSVLSAPCSQEIRCEEASPQNNISWWQPAVSKEVRGLSLQIEIEEALEVSLEEGAKMKLEYILNP